MMNAPSKKKLQHFEHLRLAPAQLLLLKGGNGETEEKKEIIILEDLIEV